MKGDILMRVGTLVGLGTVIGGCTFLVLLILFFIFDSTGVAIGPGLYYLWCVAGFLFLAGLILGGAPRGDGSGPWTRTSFS